MSKCTRIACDVPACRFQRGKRHATARALCRGNVSPFVADAMPRVPVKCQALQRVEAFTAQVTCVRGCITRPVLRSLRAFPRTMVGKHFAKVCFREIAYLKESAIRGVCAQRTRLN